MRSELEKKFTQYLLYERGLTPKSIKAYITHVRYLYSEASGDVLCLCMTYNDVANLIMAVRDKRRWSDRMTYKVACMASVFFNWAAREGLIEDSPMRLGHGFKKACQYKQPDFFDWESEDFKKILEDPNNTIRMTAILHVLKSSGVRAGELCNLRLSDVDGRWLRVRQGKTGDRYAPIDVDCRLWLDLYIGKLKRHYNGEWLFPKEDLSGPITSHGLWRMLSNKGRKLGIRLTPHKFRHSVAGKLLAEGADLAIAQQILGHKNIGTTANIYTHLPKKKLLEQYDKFTGSG